MYEPGLYRDLPLATIRQKVIELGFDPIQIEDRPGDVYTPHQHAETKLLAFLKGGMTVQVAGETFHCRAGDQLIIPSSVEHAAVVDSDGCIYFWSERLA